MLLVDYDKDFASVEHALAMSVCASKFSSESTTLPIKLKTFIMVIKS